MSIKQKNWSWEQTKSKDSCLVLEEMIVVVEWFIFINLLSLIDLLANQK